MPDTNRLPRIGEIWKGGEHNKRVLVTYTDDCWVYVVRDTLETDYEHIDYFTEHYVPTGTEYDLDPLVLALKGERT